MAAKPVGKTMSTEYRRQIVKARHVVTAMAIALALMPTMGRPAAAATAIGTFSVALVIQSTCEVASTAAPDFTIAMQCTHPIPYNVGLDDGTSGNSAPRIVTSRIAASPSDATNGSDTTPTGTSLSGPETRSLAQNEPALAPAANNDTLTVTVTY